jgi:hypothetical protein
MVADVCREEGEGRICVTDEGFWSLRRGEGGTEFRSGAILSRLYAEGNGNEELLKGISGCECRWAHLLQPLNAAKLHGAHQSSLPKNIRDLTTRNSDDFSVKGMQSLSRSCVEVGRLRNFRLLSREVRCQSTAEPESLLRDGVHL